MQSLFPTQRPWRLVWHAIVRPDSLKAVLIRGNFIACQQGAQGRAVRPTPIAQDIPVAVDSLEMDPLLPSADPHDEERATSDML